MISCPPHSELHRLVTGDLKPHIAAQFDRHVETCTVCQNLLAQMTESADADRWRILLAESPEPNGVQQVTTPPSESRPEPIPEIPGYRIIREIGRGGAAIVYLARQTSLNRLVALKVLRGGIEPGGVQRFRVEAEAAAQLRHPNIVVVHEVGEGAGLFFLALEYVDGGTLADLAGRKPLPARTAASILKPVTRALHHAHQVGVVHRDVKPSNILLQRTIDTTETIPKVCDFGLARRLDEGSGLTRTRDLLGTPAYMAPELVMDAGQASPRSDVYAVGVVLYELLTGRPPFIGNTPLDTLLQARDREPVAPRRLQPSTPLDLQTICLKCLEKEPERRYISACELGDDLHRFLNGQPVVARPISSVEQVSRWARRHKSLSAMLALIAFLILGGSAAALVAATYFRNMARDMVQLAGEKDAERRKAEEQRELTLRTLYFTRTNLAGQSLQAEDGPHQIEQFLREWRGLKANFDPRGWEWFYLTSRVNGAARILHGHELDVLAVAWSPDGRRLASAGFGRALHIWNGDTGRQMSMTKAGWGIQKIAWSRDGRRIITLGADNKVFVHDAETGEQTQQLLNDKKVSAFSPDCQHFVGFSDNRVELWNDAGQKLGEFAGHSEPPLIATWNPVDGTIASCDNSGRVCLWHHNTQQLVRELTTGNSIAALKWSPDGQRLACSHTLPKITLWDVATGRLVQELLWESRFSATCIDFTTDGQTIAAGLQDGTVRLWNLAQVVPPITLSEHHFVVHCVAFRPGSQWLASSSGNWNGQIKLWRFADITESHDLGPVAPNECHVASVSAGQHIVVGDAQGYRVIDARTGNAVRTIPGSTLRGNPITADGRRFIGRDEKNALTVFEIDGRLRALPTEMDQDFVRRLAVSHDGRYMATTTWTNGNPNRFTMRIWDLRTHKKVKESSGNGGAWSPDGKLFAVGDVYNISILDTQSFQVIATWPSPDVNNSHLCFSPDNRQLACTYRNNVVVRDATDGKILFQLVGHNDFVQSVQWSPDSSRIATAGSDGTVRLWDGASGQLILTLRGHKGPVFSVAWSPDGKQLVSAGSGTVRNWNATRGYELEQIHEPLPIDSRSYQDSTTPYSNAGWWVIDEEEWNPDGPDPFTHPKIRPRWFSPSDDPNGFLPLANNSVVYLHRVYATTNVTAEFHRDGEIVTHLWWNGQQLKDAAMNPISLSPGWHTFAVRIADPIKQSDVIARPNAGLYLRIESK